MRHRNRRARRAADAAERTRDQGRRSRPDRSRITRAEAEYRYGLDVEEDAELLRLRRLEEQFGQRQIRAWRQEGIPLQAMGDADAIGRYRQRTDSPVPWNVEAENESSVQRSERAAADVAPAGDTQILNSVRNVISSRGRALDASIQHAMEERMGDSLGDVRIHTGSRAAKACEDVNARAFTVGNHVAFNRGEYDPGSPEGQHVLAHELAHVRQETDGALSMLPQEDLKLEIDPEIAGRLQRLRDDGDLDDVQRERLGDLASAPDPRVSAALREMDGDALDDLTKLDVDAATRRKLATTYVELDSTAQSRVFDFIDQKGQHAVQFVSEADDGSVQIALRTNGQSSVYSNSNDWRAWRNTIADSWVDSDVPNENIRSYLQEVDVVGDSDIVKNPDSLVTDYTGSHRALVNSQFETERVAYYVSGKDTLNVQSTTIEPPTDKDFDGIDHAITFRNGKARYVEYKKSREPKRNPVIVSEWVENANSEKKFGNSVAESMIDTRTDTRAVRMDLSEGFTSSVSEQSIKQTIKRSVDSALFGGGEFRIEEIVIELPEEMGGKTLVGNLRDRSTIRSEIEAETDLVNMDMFEWSYE